DSGVSPHGENAREFELMVEGGLSPMKAIQSATLEAARLLKAEDRLGTIEPQKLADLIAVNGDPLAEIGTLRNVVFVMKDGVVYKQP
ncbi:MAG TPA: amidohydrolase family protein, partial [Planctomycetaceae bacterium]|nr:amidohydrolase family protein [Planctomycetaceae bacterium]